MRISELFFFLCTFCGRKITGNFEFGVVWDSVHRNTFFVRRNTGVAVIEIASIYILVGV
jgi:hypothetical protein